MTAYTYRCSTFRKIDDKWKAVTVHVIHNYQASFGFENLQVGYDVGKKNRNWWKVYSLEVRKKIE